jgi:hypothetical protein
MRGSFRLHLILPLATTIAGPALANTDPTMCQVYEAVRTGHLEQAQKMVDQALNDHPKSAKAHYIAADVDAASGNLALGRQELSIAQELAPGLPFAAPESVEELLDKLWRTPSVHAPTARSHIAAWFLWSVLAVVVIGRGVVVAFGLMKRSAPTDNYEQPRGVG